VKAGFPLPVTVVFDVAPPSGTNVEIALSLQSSAPSVLAYGTGFVEENASTYSGFIDLTDARLMTAVSGSAGLPVNCEVRWTPPANPPGGLVAPLICENFELTVEPPLFSGPQNSEGGPVYLTAAQLAVWMQNVQAVFASYAPLVQLDQENGNLYRLVFVNGLPSGQLMEAAEPGALMPASQYDQDNGNLYALVFVNGLPSGQQQATAIPGPAPASQADTTNGRFYRLVFVNGEPAGQQL
jgi:hypothetical protein